MKVIKNFVGNASPLFDQEEPQPTCSKTVFYRVFRPFFLASWNFLLVLVFLYACGAEKKEHTSPTVTVVPLLSRTKTCMQDFHELLRNTLLNANQEEICFTQVEMRPKNFKSESVEVPILGTQRCNKRVRASWTRATWWTANRFCRTCGTPQRCVATNHLVSPLSCRNLSAPIPTPSTPTIVWRIARRSSYIALNFEIIGKSSAERQEAPLF